mgnify:CR=1 FL=1
MKTIKKIFSIIFNPLTNLFKIETSIDDKHHFFVWLLTLLCVVALMIVVYMFIW